PCTAKGQAACEQHSSEMRSSYLREINNGIRKQIRNRDKTKAGMRENAAIAAMVVRRRSVRGLVERLDARFQDLYPSHRAPMKWERGVYIVDRKRLAKRKNGAPHFDRNAGRLGDPKDKLGMAPHEFHAIELGRLANLARKAVPKKRGPKGPTGQRVTVRQGKRRIPKRK